MPLSSAQRVAAYRARQREAGAPDASRRGKAQHDRAYQTRRIKAGKPFTGCDGEGCGVDELGRQLYMLFRMGERELYTGSRLTTEELLGFICDHPKGEILVGFAFGYDVTMILRDLPEKQQRRLFEPKMFGAGFSPFVWYKDFDIDYLPRNYLKVRRVKTIRDPETGKEKRVAVKGSQRVIYEVFGLFQKSFIKAMSDFSVGGDDLARIAANKERRGEFVSMGQEEREYCALECKYLAELMDRLRGFCHEANIFPRSWSGAGKLAAALHQAHNTTRSKVVQEKVPAEVIGLANMAYYGGRFEITRTGQIEGEVHEYDIGSAYPWALLHMPCLEHGEWTREDAAGLHRQLSNGGLFIAYAGFKCKPRGVDNHGQLGGLPVRDKLGHLYWPLQGNGIYWSVELESATQVGMQVKLGGGWAYHKRCDCHPFDWVEELYEYRKTIGKQGPGYPIKLGINSLYGKLAQRKGNGQFNNMIWAGLVTAHTRARLNHAISLAPESIVMLATDGVYSLDPLPLGLGDKLGDWEHQVMPGLFIVQPGLYWCPAKRKRKSRGLSGRFFEEEGRTESFEAAWETFRAGENSGLEQDFPAVSVPVPGFTGLKLAIARNKPETAGRWTHDTREISFDYRNKRIGHRWEGHCIVTKPKMGSSSLVSLPHREFLAQGGQEPWEHARLMLEEQPDWVDYSSPWSD